MFHKEHTPIDNSSVDLNLLRTIEISAFLHDVGKPIARYLDISTDPNLTKFGIFATQPEIQESLKRDSELFKELKSSGIVKKQSLPNHVFAGLVLLQSPFLETANPESHSIFTVTKEEEKFWKRLKIDPVHVKAAILLHHFNNAKTVEEFLTALFDHIQAGDDLINRYLEAYEKVTSYVREGDHTEATQRAQHSETSISDLYNLLTLLGRTDENQDGTVTHPTVAFDPIHEQIQNFRQEAFYKLKPDKKVASNTTKNFVEEFKKIFTIAETPIQLLSFLKLLFYRYLLFTPADIMEKIPIISLYEHLYSTALVASNIYLVKTLNRAKLGLIFIDFPSIQQYIYNIYSTKHALKTLKAKSFLVQLLPELAKTYIYEKLSAKGYISYFHEVLNVGGKVSIIIPATEEVKQELIEIKKELEENLFDKFKGEIKMAFAFESKPLTLQDSNRNILAILKELISDTNEHLRTEKNRPFATILFNHHEDQAPYLIPTSVEQDTTLCDICNLYPAQTVRGEGTEDEIHLCKLCDSYERIGRELKDAHFLAITPHNMHQNLRSPSFANLFSYDLHLLSSKDLRKTSSDLRQLHNLILIDIDFYGRHRSGRGTDRARKEKPDSPISQLKSLILNTTHVDIIPISKYIYKENNQPATLEQLSKHRYLAILKGDVDNLGKIFREELERLYAALHSSRIEDQSQEPYPISYRRTASFWFKFFFEILIEKAIIEPKAQSQRSDPFKIYTVYIGGDDFVILGDWLDIYDLAQKLETNWKRFTNNNPRLTFSASITLFKDKTPVLYTIEKAEENLHRAKYLEENKNKIYLLQDVADKEVFIRLEIGGVFEEETLPVVTTSFINILEPQTAQKNQISTGFLYKLFTLLTQLRDRERTSALKTEDLEYFKAYTYYLLKRYGFLQKDSWQQFAEALKNTKIEHFTQRELRNLIAVLSYIIYERRENESG